MVDVATVPTLTEADQWIETVPELQNGWRPTGGAVNPATDGGLLNWPLQVLTARSRYLYERWREQQPSSDEILVTVGPGGNYATMNAALVDLSRRQIGLGSSLARIRLLAGFVLAEQIIISGLNLGWIVIEAVDPVVTISRAALTRQFGTGYPAFAATQGGFLPQIFARFVMDGSGVANHRHGIAVAIGASGFVGPGCGVVNAGGNGAIVHGATLFAQEADFGGAAVSGINAVRGGIVEFYKGKAKGCGLSGIETINGAWVFAPQADVSGSPGLVGVRATGMGGIDITGGNARCLATDGGSDIWVDKGGTICAIGATGGTGLTPNTLTANGVIYK